VPDVLITAEDTPRGKPDPTGYLLAASSLGIPPGQCLGIEDSPAGIRAAVQAGMTALGVTNSHSAKELSQAHAVISSLAGLRASVDNARWPPELIVSISNTTVSAESHTDPQ
jgi:sugar-phosphatase